MPERANPTPRSRTPQVEAEPTTAPAATKAVAQTNTPAARYVIREASPADLPALIALLANDSLGRTRQAPYASNAEPYDAAFAAIAADPHNTILVAVDASKPDNTEPTQEGSTAPPCACLQLTFIPGLSYSGGWRAQVEAVRVHEDHRGAGLGRLLIEEAVRRARLRGAVLVQLTSDLRRERARRFYEGLGFQATHAGMKLWL